MDKDFYIKTYNGIESISNSFGVFSGKVKTPNTYVCPKNSRLYSRFFYVVNGLIIFNKNTKKELCAPAGTIVYLPSDATYKSEWPAGEVGEYISINFQIADSFLELPDKICIVTFDNTILKCLRMLTKYGFKVQSDISSKFCPNYTKSYTAWIMISFAKKRNKRINLYTRA